VVASIVVYSLARCDYVHIFSRHAFSIGICGCPVPWFELLAASRPQRLKLTCVFSSFSPVVFFPRRRVNPFISATTLVSKPNATTMTTVQGVTGLLALQNIVEPKEIRARNGRSNKEPLPRFKDIAAVEKSIRDGKKNEKRAYDQINGLFDHVDDYRDTNVDDDMSSLDSEQAEQERSPSSPTPSSSKKTLFLRNKSVHIALNTGFTVRGAPEVFASYVGAPCPICYEDLGKKVPKGTDFGAPFVTAVANETRVNTQIKEMKSDCAAHSAEVHPKFPIWNCFRTQDLRNTSHMRKKNMEITTAGLLHNAMKGAYDGVPFEQYFPITPESINQLCICRLGYASCHVAYNSGNYFRGKSGLKTNAAFQIDVSELIEKIRTQFREHYDYEVFAQMIQRYSSDQIMGVCNLFFVYMDYYLLCPSWFYQHEQPQQPNVIYMS
jgi:hypothetical protein